MNDLINQLKKEHEALGNLLLTVQKIGVSSNESKQLLIKAKKALLAHLSKEDKELYPVLRKISLTNEEYDRKLNSFAKDMDEITSFVLSFFDNIEKDKYSQLQYAKDFGKLLSKLTSRISREERILYPMYEKCK